MSPIERIQTDIAAALTALAYSVDIPIFVWRPRADVNGNTILFPAIQSKINLALAGVEKKNSKAGIAAIVLMPVVQIPNEETPGPHCRIAISIRIRERTTINMQSFGTKKTAEDVAWEFQRELHQYALGYSTLVCEGTSIAPVSDETDTSGDVIYNLECVIDAIGVRPTRVEPVAITNSGLNVTLTTSTGSAAIYYTTDGSFPHSANTDASTYSVPFAVTSGDTVRAAAFKSGLSPSHATIKTITA